MNLSLNKVFLTSLTILLLFMFSLSLVHAQGNDASTSTQTINGGEEPLDGITVETPKSVPSGFGLWLRDWQEKISLALTFEPVKKAEKQLLFAEERMKIAEKIMAENTNPEAQAKALKMIEQAQKHIAQLQEKKDKWIEQKDVKVERLKNNLATHELRKDEILAKIEEKLPEDVREKFSEMREKILDEAKSLIGNIDDGELSEKTVEHLIDVRERVEASKATISEYREQKKEILKDSDLSEEQIKQQIELLWEQRKSKMEEIRLQYKEHQENLRNTFEKPDEADKIKLERIKKAREFMQSKNELFKEYTNKIFELRKENINSEELQKKVMEFKAELEKKIRELENEGTTQEAEEIRENVENDNDQIEKESENESEDEVEIENIETSN